MLTKLKEFFKKEGTLPPPDPDPASAENAPADSDAAEERVFARDERDTQSWVGVGLDGVLARRLDAPASGKIGDLVPDMAIRVEDWVRHKRLNVRVLTGRAASAEGRQAVCAWLERHGLGHLEVTHAKDLHMVEYWDDHAVQVLSNLGTVVGRSPNGLDADPAKNA